MFIIEMYSLCFMSTLKHSPAEVLTVDYFGLGSIFHVSVLSLFLFLD